VLHSGGDNWLQGVQPFSIEQSYMRSSAVSSSETIVHLTQRRFEPSWALSQTSRLSSGQTGRYSSYVIFWSPHRESEFIQALDLHFRIGNLYSPLP